MNEFIFRSTMRCLIVQAAPIALRSAKAAINEGLETDLANGMNVEEQQYAKVLGSSLLACCFANLLCTGAFACLPLPATRSILLCACLPLYV